MKRALRSRRPSHTLFRPMSSRRKDSAYRSYDMPSSPPLTATTALPRARAIIDDLLKLVADLAPQPVVRQLEATLRTLKVEANGSNLLVDVAVYGQLDDTTARRVAARLSPNLDPTALSLAEPASASHAISLEEIRPIRVRVFQGESSLVVRAGEIFPPILVFIIAERLGNDVTPPGSMVTLFDDRPYVALMDATGTSDLTALQHVAQGHAWYAEILPADSVSAAPFAAQISTPPWTIVVDLLSAYAVLRALKSAVEGVRVVLEQEERRLRAKRVILQQQATRIQQPSGTSPNELVMELRAQVQRQVGEFEHGIQQRLRSLFAPQIGTLTREAEQLLNMLKPLDEQPGEKRVILTVPDVFDRQLRSKINERVRAHCVSDLRSLADLYALMKEDVDQQLASDGARSLLVSYAYPDADRLDTLLAIHFRIDRPYRGELPRRSMLNEIARAPQRVWMMLSPLSAVIIGSAAQQAIQHYSPVALAMLVVAGFFTHRSIKREHAESLERETERARESLRAELRRSFGDFDREWSAFLSEHLRGQLGVLAGQAEASLRDLGAARAAQAAEEKRKTQRQVQTLELDEKRLRVSRAGADTLTASLGQARGELRQLVVSSFAASRGKPT